MMSKPSIVFLDSFTLAISGDAFAPIQRLGQLTLYDRTSEQHLIGRASHADIVLTNKTPLTAGSIEQLDRLKFIAVTATGHNVVDASAAATRSIPVSNVPEYGTDTVAQHVFAMILELCNRVGLHDASVQRGEWTASQDWCYTLRPLTELHGKTIGIIGFGRIGRLVGAIARSFGMDVIVCSGHSVPPQPPYPFRLAPLHELLGESDVITLHCPLTKETAGMIDARHLAMMKREAFLINCSRGGLVVERDLADALNGGTLASAAVDVVSEEPIKFDNPLIGARNCLITPHIAWATREAKARLIQKTADNIAAFLAGQPINVVNFPVKAHGARSNSEARS